MKALGDLAPLLAGPVTQLCRLVRFTTLAGAVYTLTDLDVSITVGGVLYRADIGVDLSNAAAQDGTSQSSVDITMLLQPGYITREMLVAGALDGAACVISVCDWVNLVSSPYMSGTVRHITFNDDVSAGLEIVNALDSNLQIAADQYCYTCRVDLGSPKCGVPLAATSKPFTVTAALDRQLIQTNLTDADDYWVNGLLSWTTGANEGRAVEIAGYAQASGAVVLKLPTAFAIAVGDTGSMYRGCNKTPQDCCDKWNNMPNYRGEPTGVPIQSTSPTLQGTLPPTTPAPAPTGTLTATPAEIKRLKQFVSGSPYLPSAPKIDAQLAADGFITDGGAVGGSYAITAAGLQQLTLAGYTPNPTAPGGS